jgi:hypothetical protein
MFTTINGRHTIIAQAAANTTGSTILIEPQDGYDGEAADLEAQQIFDALSELPWYTYCRILTLFLAAEADGEDSLGNWERAHVLRNAYFLMANEPNSAFADLETIQEYRKVTELILSGDEKDLEAARAMLAS